MAKTKGFHFSQLEHGLDLWCEEADIDTACVALVGLLIGYSDANWSGVFRVSLSQLARAAKLESSQDVVRAFRKLAAVGFLAYCDDTRMVWIRKMAARHFGAPSDSKILATIPVLRASGANKACFWPEFFTEYNTLMGLTGANFQKGRKMDHGADCIQCAKGGGEGGRPDRPPTGGGGIGPNDRPLVGNIQSNQAGNMGGGGTAARSDRPLATPVQTAPSDRPSTGGVSTARDDRAGGSEVLEMNEVSIGGDGRTIGREVDSRRSNSLVRSDPRESDPTERTPSEDGCPLEDVPHTTEDTHAQPEPSESTEAPREERQVGRGVGAAELGSPKAGVPTSKHPLAGMGSTRPPPPLVTLTEWQALPLDAKVKHVAHPSGCDAALRDHVQAFDDAAQVLYEHHARAVEDAGLMPRGDGLDAARRAVVYLSAEVPSPVLPSEAAERLMGLVDIAASKPEIVGRPLSGGVPAWVSPDVLFGASASATKFQPTAQRLPDNLNRAKAHAKITDRVRGAQLRVMEAYKPKDLPPGWSEEDAKAVADYVIAKGIAKLRKKEFEVDPSMEAKAVEMESSHAA